MSKDMNVTIRPKLEDANLSFADIHQGRWTELRLRNRKRLTDSELAAEYWAARADLEYRDGRGDGGAVLFDGELSIDKVRAFEQMIHRFATLPHASESNYE